MVRPPATCTDASGQTTTPVWPGTRANG